ncbi:hypothetical protein WDW37_13170 [Bdellovibrionota bacterium FG-1]
MIKYKGYRVLIPTCVLLLFSACKSGYVDMNEDLYSAMAAVTALKTAPPSPTPSPVTPSVFSVTPSTATITVGQPLTLQVSNGQAPFTFSILSKDANGNPVGTVSVDSESGTYTPGPNAGSAIIQVVDGVGHTAIATVIINGALQVANPMQYIEEGQTTPIAVVVGGGVPPLTYSIDTDQCGALNANSGVFTAGNLPKNCNVTVTDSASPPHVVTETVVIYAPLAVVPNAGTPSLDSDPTVGQSSFKLQVSGGSPIGTPAFTYCPGALSSCPPAAAALPIKSSTDQLYSFVPMNAAGDYTVCATDSQSNTACTPIAVHSSSVALAFGVPIFPQDAPQICKNMPVPKNNPVQITTKNSVSVLVTDGYALPQTYSLTPLKKDGTALAGVTLNPNVISSNQSMPIQVSGQPVIAGFAFDIHVQNATNPNQVQNLGILIVAPPVASPTTYPSNAQNGDSQLFAFSDGVGPYCAPSKSGTYAASVGANGLAYTFGNNDLTAPVTFYDSLGNSFKSTQAGANTFTGLMNIDSITSTSLTAHYEMLNGDQVQSNYAMSIQILGKPAAPPASASLSSYSYSLPLCNRSCSGTDCACTFTPLAPGVSYQVTLTYKNVPTNQTASTTALTINVPAPGISVSSPLANQAKLQWPLMTVGGDVPINGYTLYYAKGAQNSTSTMSALINIAAANVTYDANQKKYTYTFTDVQLLTANNAFTFTVVPIINGVLIPPIPAQNAISFPSVLIQ